MTGWIWLIVVAFLVTRALVSMNKKASTQDDQARMRPFTRDRRVSSPEDSWLADRSTPNISAMGPNPAWMPQSQPGQPNAGWAPAWQPGPSNVGWAPESPVSAAPTSSSPGWQQRLASELAAPPDPAVVEDAVAAEPPQASLPPLTSFAHDRSDIGSAALESTLDSTIESSLFGAAPGPVTQSLLPGAATEQLPPEIEAAVVAFMVAGHEVAAVRFLCDELDMAIFDALRTAREAAGLPIS
ncbi:MAG: hypothetical protein M3445_08680 [Actinomycetota bacterium]|nr:hypothetical protein [Actinomycetota bacterium]